jgi:hypothetical protein
VCIIIDLKLRSLYVGYCIVCCLIFVSFVSFALGYYSFHFFHYSFYICFLFCMFLLSILCVLCIVSSHVYNCLFSICLQVYWPLSPDGNSVAVNKDDSTSSEVYHS